MTRNKGWLRLFAVVLAGALLFAACGGDDDEGSDTSADTTEAPADDAGGEGERASLAVSVVDNSFDPTSLSAAAGSVVSIEVTNDGSNPHTFSIDDVDVDTGTLNGGDSTTVTFTMPDGDLQYYCKIHGADVMSGTITP